MPWVKLDDRFWSNQKVRRSGEAIATWVLCLCWSADNLTDGKIPEAELGFVCSGVPDRAAHVERLIQSGLMVRDGSILTIPDYLEFNPSAADVAETREKDRIRKRRQREGQGRNPDGTFRAESHRDTERTHGRSPAVPDPTRPDPNAGGIESLLTATDTPTCPQALTDKLGTLGDKIRNGTQP